MNIGFISFKQMLSDPMIKVTSYVSYHDMAPAEQPSSFTNLDLAVANGDITRLINRIDTNYEFNVTKIMISTILVGYSLSWIYDKITD